MHGEQSSVAAYRVFYRLAGPMLHAARRIAPRHLLTTEAIGRAMLSLARRRWPQPILEASDIHDAAVRQDDAE